LNLGRALFDLREYQKCAHLLQSNSLPSAVFLRNQALYQLSEQNLEEEILEAGGAQHKVS